MVAAVVDAPIKCEGCGKIHMTQAARPWAFICHRCKTMNQSPVK